MRPALAQTGWLWRQLRGKSGAKTRRPNSAFKFAIAQELKPCRSKFAKLEINTSSISFWNLLGKLELTDLNDHLGHFGPLFSAQSKILVFEHLKCGQKCPGALEKATFQMEQRGNIPKTAIRQLVVWAPKWAVQFHYPKSRPFVRFPKIADNLKMFTVPEMPKVFSAMKL